MAIGITGQPATPRTASQKMDQFYAALWTYFAPPLTCPMAKDGLLSSLLRL